ncbi:ribose import binding protein RbsB [Abditibacteriota bacterium]|nr:ribose import binding protein RbsB [Abditibacteriota bacterium]
MKNPVFFASALSLLALVGCNNSATTTAEPANSSAQSPTDATKPTIAVIPKGTTHSYWKSVEAGANKAGTELGANIVFKGPVQESDRASQIKIVEQFVSDGISAIVLAPLDDAALVKPVREAKGKKIPVVIIDSALKAQPGVDYTSFVSTDNVKGGMLAGDQLVKVLGGKGKVVLLRYQEGSASTADREKGFLSAIKKAPGITLISDNRYAGATAGEAKTSALNMVDKLREADGIFTPNESSSLGMLLALRQVGLTGKKKFVGFDASKPLLEGLNKGEIDGLVAQNPTKMGYEGVKAAYQALKGQKVETQMDTGVAVITKDNLNTPAVKEVLNENK